MQYFIWITRKKEKKKSSGNLPVIVFELLVFVAGRHETAAGFGVADQFVHLELQHQQVGSVESHVLHLRHSPKNDLELTGLPGCEVAEIGRLLERT